MPTDARVILWDREIGAITWFEDREIGVFQYTPDFARSGIELSPLMMPLGEAPYSFPALARDTFKGLPGLLADSLPDKFGNAVINEWLASQNREPSSLNPVERLCYTGKRGMGALEYEPTLHPAPMPGNVIYVDKLVKLANRVLNQREGLHGAFGETDDRKEIENILRVGTSAGGARAKAILAWNPKTGKFRSGQIRAGKGFEYWLMKFDGITNNADKELADPQGFGKIEYAYHLIAKEIGIEMAECRLHHEGRRSHFMTRRFDRDKKGGKIHMQSLGAIAHYDFNQQESYSYEQAIRVMRRIGLPLPEIEQQVLRAYFNVIGRNQDDHVKNIAFLMDRSGRWSLAPAFDMAYAYEPRGQWTSRHQMSIDGKRDNFSKNNLINLAEFAGIKKRRAAAMLNQVVKAFAGWPKYAEIAEVNDAHTTAIESSLRLDLA